MCTDKKYILFSVIFLLSTVCFSQYNRRPPFVFKEGLSVSVKGGLNVFYGDLVDKSRNSYSFGATLDREMNEIFTLRTQLMSGAMKGTQLNNANNPHVNFNNFYLEWTVGGTYNILNHINGYFKERTFQPYAMLHTGLIYYNAKEYWGGDQINLLRKASEVAPIVGLGGGTTIWINPRLKANLEFYGNYAFSDMIDAHKYKAHRENPERDKTDYNDFYYTATVGLSYVIGESRFGNDVKHLRKSYDKLRKFYNRKNQRSRR